MKKTILAALLAASCAPALAGDYYVVVPVKNRTPTSGNITVALNPNVLPSGVVGRTYAGYDFNALLQVRGDPNFSLESVRWSIAGGALPAGLSLSPYGKLSGTPSAPSKSALQVMATYKTKTGQQAYEVVVGDVAVALAEAALPAGVQGANYFVDLKPRLSVAGDPQYTPAQVTWTFRGTLPAGLTLKTDGTISGVPTAGGTSSFEVLATYLGKSGARAYEVVVGEITVVLAGATPPVGTLGTPYTAFDLKPRLTVEGDAAYTGAGVVWSVDSGALPTGLVLDATTGLVEGTPTARAAGPVTLKAAYKNAAATQSYLFTFNDALKQYAGYRAWTDGALAASCKEYRSPASSGNYRYQGATGDGVYRIKPGSSAVDVYCDMSTDGGGWTLVMTNNLPNFTNMSGAGTTKVCTTIRGCNTGGTSSFFLNTPVESTISEMMMTATSTGQPYELTWKLVNPAKFVRDSIPAPGISLFRLMTDSTPGWAPVSLEGIDGEGDRNDPARGFRGTSGLWSDGNWHGIAGRAGMQIRWTTAWEWGHHHYTAPTFDGTNYVLGPWTHSPFFNAGTSSTVPKAAAENLYRWTIFVR